MKDIKLNCTEIPKIIVIEGFDCTGKSYFINEICTKLNNFIPWEPKYHTDLVPKVLPINSRYVLGMALIDLVESGLADRRTYIVNRGLLSGVVYNDIYQQDIPNMMNKEFYDYVESKYSNPSLIHTIYITHKDKNSAKFLYDSAVSRTTNESYDKFESFEKYWEMYEKFNKKYGMALDSLCNDNYTIISSLDNENL